MVVGYACRLERLGPSHFGPWDLTRVAMWPSVMVTLRKIMTLHHPKSSGISYGCLTLCCNHVFLKLILQDNF